MGFNGSGTFVRAHNWVSDKNAAVKITASRMDTEDDGFAAGLSNTICRDGQSTITAAIPFNNQRITGLGDAAAAQDALNRRSGDARYLLQSASGLDGPYGTVAAVAASTVDCQLGTHFTKTVAGALSWTFTNAPVSGKAFGFLLELANGGAGAQTWPAAVKWDNNAAPTFQASGVDVVGFLTRDGGATWRGKLVYRASS
jgi:hypothetical protein